MREQRTIHVLGAGAIGVALAAQLAQHGRQVQLVRTSAHGIPRQSVYISVNAAQHQESWTQAEVEMVSLDQLKTLDGVIAITAKAYANRDIALQLASKKSLGPIVLLQNGIGIEEAYQTAGFSDIYRGVLYSTSQTIEPLRVQFRAVKASPIGLIEGDVALLASCVQLLNTTSFPFVAVSDIAADVWSKGIINAIFNTLCPLLEVDNGIFARDQQASAIAADIMRECLEVARDQGVNLAFEEQMKQLLQLSQATDGQLISTLQDIQNQRETELDTLNFAIARLAAIAKPAIKVTQTKMLGELTALKAALSINKASQA